MFLLVEQIGAAINVVIQKDIRIPMLASRRVIGNLQCGFGDFIIGIFEPPFQFFDLRGEHGGIVQRGVALALESGYQILGQNFHQRCSNRLSRAS